MKFSKGILITAILISGLITACGSPRLVVPKIEYKAYAELKAAEPSCVPKINVVEQMFLSGSGIEQENACIEGMKCYSDVKQYWEGYYRVLDAKVKAAGE